MYELNNNIATETGWEIIEKSFDPEQMVTTGSNFMIGNGYLGYRGTFAEWQADRYVACIVTDTWDKAPGSLWSELCTVPNGLFTTLQINGEPFSAFSGQTSSYRRCLDLRYGLNQRSLIWKNSRGTAVRLSIEKFSSLADLPLLPMSYQVEALDDAEITLFTGIDGRIWSLNGEHFQTYTPFVADDILGLETRTGESNIQVNINEGIKLDGQQPESRELIKEEKLILHKLKFNLKAGQCIRLEKTVTVHHSNETAEPRQNGVLHVQQALKSSYEELKKAHQHKWDAIWNMSDIRIKGNIEAQVLTRFNLYQAIIATPAHAKLPIGARGLSSQVYQGAAFWDQETFNLPMYLYTHPAIARNLLEYRYATLPGARKKARQLGYYGAFYAWTSGKSGEELFPDYFFTDVLTGRKIHNHFNSWQIHISPDIVYALWLYYEASGDWEFILNYGAEIAFEVAQFLVSHLYFKKDKNRYEIIRLLGPDEYHENVDNNAYTNYMAHFALEKALLIFRRLQTENPAHLDKLLKHIKIDHNAAAAWQDIVNLLYLPGPHPVTNLIEQFDGFFQLEDITPGELRKRLINPEEYWGWPNGIAIEAQVLKQADVLQLFALQDRFSSQVMRANYDYYECRTEHGSSLSPSVHALVATWAGYADEAYRYFYEASTIDLYNASKKVMSGGSFLGGIHTAAAGGVWLILVKGFAGFKITADTIQFKPALPGQWQSLAFKLVVKGNTIDVEIDHAAVTVRAGAQNPGSLKIAVGKNSVSLLPGASHSFNGE